MPAVPTGTQPCCERCTKWFCRRRLALGDARPQVRSWLHGLTLPGALLCVALSHSADTSLPP